MRGLPALPDIRQTHAGSAGVPPAWSLDPSEPGSAGFLASPIHPPPASPPHETRLSGVVSLSLLPPPSTRPDRVTEQVMASTPGAGGTPALPALAPQAGGDSLL